VLNYLTELYYKARRFATILSGCTNKGLQTDIDLESNIQGLFYFDETLSRMNNRFSFFLMPPRSSSIDAISVRQSPSGGGRVEEGFFSNLGFSTGLAGR
jgi:hypothetical protein